MTEDIFGQTPPAASGETTLFVTGVVTIELACIVVAAVVSRRRPTAGLFISLCLASLLWAAAAVFSENGMSACSIVSVANLCIGVLATLGAVATSTQGPRGTDLPNFIAKFLLCILGTICLLVLPWFPSPFTGVLGFFFWVLLGGTVCRYFLIARQNMAMEVVSTIGSAIRQNLPLPQVLAAQSLAQSGYLRKVLSDMSEMLWQGVPLGECIRQCYRKCPGFIVAMLSAAERVHQVPAAIESIQMFLQGKSRDDGRMRPVNAVYPVVIVGFALMILSGVTVYVVPMFENIFADMGERLPAVSRIVMAGAGPVGSILVFVEAVVVLVVLPTYVYTRFRRRRPWSPALWSRIGDWVKWRLPVMHWFEMNRSVFHTASFLRLALLAGCTVDAAIGDAAALDINGVYRRRLARWQELVQQGQDVSQAARKARVGKALAWAFDQQVNPGNAPAVLEMLASHYCANYGYVSGIARLIFWPVVVMVIGLAVGAVVVGMFMPLVAMISSMTGAGGLP